MGTFTLNFSFVVLVLVCCCFCCQGAWSTAMGSMLAKASRTTNSSTPAEDSIATYPCMIDDLDDLTLIEILQRLPTAEFATQCKSVSRRWHSLICSRHFASRFTEHHRTKPKPFAFILNYGNLDGQQLRIVAKDPVFKPSLKMFLAGLNLLGVRIIASYNDLPLYEAVPCQQYYLCNPITRLWVVLPPCLDKYKYKRVLVGLVYKHLDSKVDSIRVVRIPQDEGSCSSFIVEIFSFETNQWNESIVLHPYNFLFKMQEAFGYNGILYWLTQCDSIVAYDPHKSENCSLINAPPKPTKIEVVFSYSNLGMWQGSLRLLQFIGQSLPLHWVVGIWELKDFDITGMWNLKHELFLDTLVWELDLNQPNTFDFGCLALDENNEHKAYLECKQCVLSCNFKTQELKVEDRALYGQRILYFSKLVLPPWPTLTWFCS